MKQMAWILTAVMWAAPAGAQQQGVSVQQALDKPVELDVADAPIGEVFDELQASTGVNFIIDEDTLEYLPYGDQTRLAVTLRHVTLRKALSPMLAPQALQWEIEDNAIRIRPSEPLYRIGRRATFEELTTLGHLLTDRLQAPNGRPVIDQIRAATGNDKLRLFFHVEADETAATTRAARALPGPAADWLETLVHGQGWTWYLWGDDIVIVDRAMQVQRQLEKQVSLRYENTSLVTVLLDLARKARVKLTLMPGVMNLLPESTRESFNLMVAEASIAQALEVISGATGLVFTQDAEGIRVEACDTLLETAEGPGRQRGRSRYFVCIVLPDIGGQEMQLFMRPEELPEDVQKMIEQSKDEYFKKLMGEEDGGPAGDAP